MPKTREGMGEDCGKDIVKERTTDNSQPTTYDLYNIFLLCC